MRNSRSTLIPALMIAVAGAAWCADWNQKPFPDWSDDTVMRLLVDSPWARARTVKLTWRKRDERPITYKDIPGADHGNPIPQGVGSPVGGIGAGRIKNEPPDRAEVIIRWASALPVRHARALYQQREEKRNPSELNQLVGAPEPDYVLEVFGLPAMVAHQGTGSVEDVARRGSWLRTRSGQTIRPNRVEAVLSALTLTIRIHFPRTAVIQLGDKEIECFGDLQLFEFKEKFRLSTMMYQNRLEL